MILTTFFSRTKRGALHRATFARAVLLRWKTSILRSRERRLLFQRAKCSRYSRIKGRSVEALLILGLHKIMHTRSGVEELVATIASMNSLAIKLVVIVMSLAIKELGHIRLIAD